MWLKNACVIKKIPINNAAAAGSDPNVAEFIEKATQTLGKKGRFVIKLSGIPQENSVLVEGKSERLCNHCIEFEKIPAHSCDFSRELAGQLLINIFIIYMANPHKYINLTVCMERLRIMCFPFGFLFL